MLLNPELYLIGGKVLGTGKWRWLPGMSAIRLNSPDRLTILSNDLLAIHQPGVGASDIPIIAKYNRLDETWIPDFNDDLTVFGFLKILQDLKKDPKFFPLLYVSDPHILRQITLIEALVAALINLSSPEAP